MCESSEMVCVRTMREMFLLTMDGRKYADFLIHHGVISSRKYCDTCGGDMELNCADWTFTCERIRRVQRTADNKKAEKVQCSTKKSAKAGTWLDINNLNPEDVGCFTAIWCLYRFPRKEFIMRELECNSQTVSKCSSLCREVCILYAITHSEKLGGRGVVVEVDEGTLGRRQYIRGRRIEGQWVFGGFERGTGRIFLLPVPARDAATISFVIREWILPETTIVSDCWRCYNKSADEEIQQLQVNHPVNFVGPTDASVRRHSNKRTWLDVRGDTPRYGRAEGHSIGHLAEFLFKRKFEGDVIHHFYKAAGIAYPSQ